MIELFTFISNVTAGGFLSQLGKVETADRFIPVFLTELARQLLTDWIIFVLSVFSVVKKNRFFALIYIAHNVSR